MTIRQRLPMFAQILVVFLLSLSRSVARAFAPSASCLHSSLSSIKSSAVSQDVGSEKSVDVLFNDFVEYLKDKQNSIISEIEELENGATFCRDTWGVFDGGPQKSGGITRVIQGGKIIEKGACSLTLIQGGVLSAERAATIRERQSEDVHEGDIYSACALSMVLHTKSPLVPTFRSDVRVFLVRSKSGESLAWFGGGADLTPYYLDENDIASFHTMYRDLCDQHLANEPDFSYESMKQSCDQYFYLPARAEHRGTGGIFFDDMLVSPETLSFVQGVAHTWMPSWLPIVKKHYTKEYSEKQKQWQLLRRGRYLEFNLLYDRGVKFGLANANPRVEGVMVSAPPQIAYEYRHEVKEGSPEAELVKVLKTPREWVK